MGAQSLRYFHMAIIYRNISKDMANMIANSTEKSLPRCLFDINFVLFELILYVPVNNFSVMSGWVFLA